VARVANSLSELPQFTPYCDYGSGARTREFRRFLGLWAKCSPKGLLFHTRECIGRRFETNDRYNWNNRNALERSNDFLLKI
jgi:hypothetical protein